MLMLQQQTRSYIQVIINIKGARGTTVRNSKYLLINWLALLQYLQTFLSPLLTVL